jgi:hypothetical protein
VYAFLDLTYIKATQKASFTNMCFVI